MESNWKALEACGTLVSVKGKVKSKQVRTSGNQLCDAIILNLFLVLLPILSNNDLVFWGSGRWWNRFAQHEGILVPVSRDGTHPAVHLQWECGDNNWTNRKVFFFFFPIYFGTWTGTWTLGLHIKSLMLCQLSYLDMVFIKTVFN